MSIKTICAGIGALALIGGLAACGAAGNPAAAPTTACGLGTYNEEVYAGQDTSCPFALNVEQVWSSAPSNTFNAYSPVTGLSYTMTCNGADTTDCTGGNNALVEFTP